MKSIFLSDLHIGVDAPTNLYQSSQHQASLKAILRHIEDNCDHIRDVVILGDWIDLWMYHSMAQPMAEMPTDRSKILPTVKQIIEANPGVFKDKDEKNKENPGNFISCINKIQGNFYYVSGNHDMNYVDKDPNDKKYDQNDSISYLIEYFKNNTKKGIRWIDCSKEKHEVYRASSEGEIYAEHGHWYSMMCKPNSPYLYKDKLPFGYFVTRAGMDAIQSTPALTIENIKGKMRKDGLKFSAALLQILAEQAGKKSWKDFSFRMPKGYENISNSEGKVSADDIVTNCFTFPYSAVDDPEFVVVDNENNLDGVAREFFTNDVAIKVVLLGHTHDSKQFQDFSVVCNDSAKPFKNQATYVNTGFLCAGSPNGNTGLPVATFVEIEDTGDNACIPAKLPYKINIRRVNFSTTTATVSATPLCTLNVVDLGNIALNKPVVASSVENSVEFAASNAVDGNDSTRWLSKCSDSQWIYVDLGQRYHIDKAQLSWANACAKEYEIEVAWVDPRDDKCMWITVYTQTEGKGGVEDALFKEVVNARYVRMSGIKIDAAGAKDNLPGYSLYGFTVYTSDPTSTTTPLFSMAQ